MNANDDTWGTSLAVQWLRPELLLRELGFHFWSVSQDPACHKARPLPKSLYYFKNDDA